MDFAEVANLIKGLGVVFSVLFLGYAGLIIMSNSDPVLRREWKEIATFVLVGLSILFLAPIISSVFTGGSYCTP